MLYLWNLYNHFFLKKSQTPLLKIYLMGLFANVAIILTSISVLQEKRIINNSFSKIKIFSFNLTCQFN